MKSVCDLIRMINWCLLWKASKLHQSFLLQEWPKLDEKPMSVISGWIVTNVLSTLCWYEHFKLGIENNLNVKKIKRRFSKSYTLKLISLQFLFSLVYIFDWFVIAIEKLQVQSYKRTSSANDQIHAVIMMDGPKSVGFDAEPGFLEQAARNRCQLIQSMARKVSEINFHCRMLKM